MIWAEKLLENKSLVFAAAAIAILAAAVLILLLFRLVFGRRLRMGGNGRTRLPRLGVVDAFDLDRNRQLVIVRRDNVEHLLMIGGPNDLVIESEIIRAESREGRLREKEPREKEFRDKETREAIPAGVNWPLEPEPPRPVVRPAGPERRTQPPPAVAPAPAAMEPPLAPLPEEVSRPAAPPPAQRPAFPLPPRRAPAFTPYAQRQPREPSQRAEPGQRIEPGVGSSGGTPRAPLATPFLRPPPRPQQDAPKQPPVAPAAESASSEPPREPLPEIDAHAHAPVEAATSPEPYVNPDPERAEPAVVVDVEKAHSFAEIFRSPAETSKDPQASDAVDTLEEEMAKLLGRGPGKP